MKPREDDRQLTPERGSTTRPPDSRKSWDSRTFKEPHLYTWLLLTLAVVSPATLLSGGTSSVVMASAVNPSSVPTTPTFSSPTSQETLLFNVTWGSSSFDHLRDISSDSLGNIYATGDTEGFGSGFSDVLLLKFDSTGGLLWQKAWGGSSTDQGYAISTDSSGNIYVTGQTNSFGAGGYDAFVLKFDSAGSLMWQRTWGGSADEWGRDLAVDTFGSVYVTGTTLTFTSGGADLFLLKLDSSGTVEWQRTWGQAGGSIYVDEVGSRVVVDASGTVYLTGIIHYFDIHGADAFLLKLNSTGGLAWQRTWAGGNSYYNDIASDLALDTNGNIFVAGQTNSFGGIGYVEPYDIFLMKLAPTGGLVWQRTWGGPGDELDAAVTVGSSDTVYLTGRTYSYSVGGSDAFLLRISPSGSLDWQKTLGGSGDDSGLAIGLSFSGNPIVAGYVAEAPPYTLSAPSFDLGTPSYALTPLSGVIANPPPALDSPDGTIMTTAGSTSYSGNTDGFLFEYGSHPASAPAPPTGLVATARVGQILLNWTAPSSNGGSPVTGYNVYRGTSSEAESLHSTRGNQTSYTDATVSGGTTYYYKVAAVNGVGEGGASNEANAAPPTVPSPPQNLQAGTAVRQASLTWTSPISNGGSLVASYKVYRGTTSGGETFLASVGAQLYYTDNSVSPGTTYYYEVTVINAAGESAFSNEAVATVPASITNPQPAPTPPAPSSSIPWAYVLIVLVAVTALGAIGAMVLVRRRPSRQP